MPEGYERYAWTHLKGDFKMKRIWYVFSFFFVLVLGLSASLQSCTANKINMGDTVDGTTTLKVDAYWDPIADSSLDLPNSYT